MCGRSGVIVPRRRTEHAFESLLDVEPLIFATTALLNAASIVNRSETEEERSGQSKPRIGTSMIVP
jgi:hypothetical protein